MWSFASGTQAPKPFPGLAKALACQSICMAVGKSRLAPYGSVASLKPIAAPTKICMALRNSRMEPAQASNPHQAPPKLFYGTPKLTDGTRAGLKTSSGPAIAFFYGTPKLTDGTRASLKPSPNPAKAFLFASRNSHMEPVQASNPLQAPPKLSMALRNSRMEPVQASNPSPGPAKTFLWQSETRGWNPCRPQTLPRPRQNFSTATHGWNTDGTRAGLKPSVTYTSTRRNFWEPSGICLRNRTPELSGTFRNPPPEPTPAHAGTPEPLSGTCSCDPHRHTPDLIWAEDPFSLRCWEKKLGFMGWRHPGASPFYAAMPGQ